MLPAPNGQKRAYLNLVRHTAVNFHEFFDAEAFERRYNGLKLCLHEYSIKPVLIADRFEYIELDEGQAVAFAILELLKELALGLVVEICVFSVLDIAQPDG